jgi:hypothetical protein
VKREKKYIEITIVLKGHALLLLDRQDGFLLETEGINQIAPPALKVHIARGM